MHAKTTVGRIASVGGQRYDQPLGVLVDERVSRLAKGRAQGSLYVLVQVAGPAAERDIIADQLAGVVRDLYYDRRGSVTSGLQLALREANNLLVEENRNSLPGEQWMAGITCAVLRDQDLFIAQAGPAVAYLLREGELARFPDVSPWLDNIPLEEMDAAPLGERRDLNVALFHSAVNSGDTLLLAHSDLVRFISDSKWAEILAQDSVPGALDALLDASAGSDLSALAVRLAEEPTEAVRPQPDLPPGEPAAHSPAPETSRPGAVSWLEQIHPGERLRTAGQVAFAALVDLWTALLTLLGRMVPSRPDSQPTSRRQPTTVKQAETRSKRSAADRAQTDLVQRVLIGVAIAIPLVVAAIVLFSVVRRGHTQRAELEALWQQASTQWQQVRAVTDPIAARTGLAGVQNALDQYLEKRPDDAEALELRRKVEARLDEINQVKRVSWVGRLARYPADAELNRIVVEGSHIFVMDRRNGKVYHHRLDSLQQALEPDSVETVLVSKGSQVGALLVNDLVDMVWMPAGNGRQKANLLILESGGSLLEYDPTTEELRSLGVAASETWQFSKLVGSYYGRFYVLDSTANKIWRYNPTADGYSDPPDDWLQVEASLAGVVDMAIGDSIYLLYADAKIRKLTAGAPDTFDISDWDLPPSSPAALFTRPPEDTKWLYVADRGNNRLVQTSKEGRFERQFRLADSQLEENGDALSQVTSLFVDEIGGHAYLLSNQKLYLLILPD